MINSLENLFVVHNRDWKTIKEMRLLFLMNVFMVLFVGIFLYKMNSFFILNYGGFKVAFLVSQLVIIEFEQLHIWKRIVFEYLRRG